MEVCSFCGQVLPEDTLRCPHCGASQASSIARREEAHARLEAAVAAYAAEGYQETSRTATTVTMVHPKEANDHTVVLVFLLAVPVALLGFLLNRRSRDRTVVLALCPDGEVTASGYRLEDLHRERRIRTILAAAAVAAALVACGALFLAGPLPGTVDAP